MELKVLKALWGMNGSLESQLKRIHEAGYAGIEAPLPGEEQAEHFAELLEHYGLDYVPQIHAADSDTFQDLASRAASFQPLLINSHSALDDMAYEDQLHFFKQALAVESELGVDIAHETHRMRAMFTPWTTTRLLRDLPELKLTADYSHWVCVCSSLLERQKADIALSSNHAVHIHGRVGYAHGPQVPDPSAPEYAHELDTHMQWWLDICKKHAARGAEYITFVPEYGPPGYLHTLPHTNQPVADLWDVCLWMADYFKAAYAERFHFN